MFFFGRSGYRLAALLGVVFAGGLLYNIKGLVSLWQTGFANTLLTLLGDGFKAAFARIPDAFSLFQSGGWGLGLVKLILPVTAIYIITDFIFDLVTGIDTPPHHVLALVASVGIVIGIGFLSYFFTTGGTAGQMPLVNETVQNVTQNVTSNVTNASGEVVFT